MSSEKAPILNPVQLATTIKNCGKEIGFDQIGITDTNLTDAAPHFLTWLKSGYFGDLTYMQNNYEKRLDPQKIMPNTKSVICGSLNYLPIEANIPTIIAKYALGRDYHKLIRKKLKLLAKQIANNIGPFNYRVFCDSAPILEKALAQKAGLGWIGKNTLLINPQLGSYCFLGVIFTDLLLPIDTPIKSRCGTCNKCITACPTRALIAPHQLDARRCIAYLTIEHQSELPVELKLNMGNKIFGCDICQQVCPWNRCSKITKEPAFAPLAHWLDTKPEALLTWDEKTFKEKTSGTPIFRLGYKRWQRNIRNALLNLKI